ncbi:MAG: lipase family protein [Candidatus Heimdallarchaeota archaeon]|nr:lipase family protein [Candidatus Heimdallarchaeota archaeon]MDH5646203.1 lipase family protein [Candidatus Heimdallarchaeota archaeon]
MSNINLDITRLMARFANAAYQDFDNLDFSDIGYTIIYTINDEDTDTQAFIARDTSNLVLSFRGTSSIKDALNDLTITRVRYPKTKNFLFHPRIHQGFFNAYSSVKSNIQSKIQSLLKDEPLEVYITGHSLGAALANITALDLVLDKIVKNPKLYTFGCPKVGNRKYTKIISKTLKNMYNVIDVNDIIPRTPPSFKSFRSYYWLENGTIHHKNHIPHLVELDPDDIVKLLSDGIKEHSMKNYRETLNQL